MLGLKRAPRLALNPTTNATYVTSRLFPAVPGVVDTVSSASREGYAIFYLTGRPASQEAATLGNLTSDGVGVDAGYPAPTTLSDGEDGLFTKPAVADYPDYLKAACAGDPNGSCTKAHYKTATRAHIESLGTTSSATSATSSATWWAATPTRRSSCRTRTTSCRNGASHCGGASIQTSRRMTRAARPQT
jgi:hypothetical protein